MDYCSKQSFDNQILRIFILRWYVTNENMFPFLKLRKFIISYEQVIFVRKYRFENFLFIIISIIVHT